MKIYQSSFIENPSAPNEIANKDYVDGKLVEASSAFAAPVFVTDVTSGGSGIVGDKEYLPGTVPQNVIVTRASTDDDSITIRVMAEGGTFYSPQLSVHGIPELPFHEGESIPLTPDDHDIRTFHGEITIAGINETTEIVIKSNTGAQTSVEIVRLANGPEVQSFNIGNYPEDQIAVRENQEMSISGLIENSATQIDIVERGAAKRKINVPTFFGEDDSGGPGFKTFDTTFIVSDNDGSHAVDIVARNQFGTQGSTRTSENTIVLDQRKPSISNISVFYPENQTAIKDTEQASITFSVVDASTTTAIFGDHIRVVTGDQSLSEEYVVEGLGTGDKTSGHNITITATLSDNGSQTTETVLVRVVNTEPSVSISIQGSPSRLVSSPSGILYTVILTSDVELATNPTPSISAPSGLLSGMSRVNSKQWRANLIIKDDDERGQFDFFNVTAFSVSGEAVSNVTNTEYVVGGFTSRDVVIPLYDSTPGNEIVGRTADIGVRVSDPQRVSVTLAGEPLSFVDNTEDAPMSFTFVDRHQGFTDPYEQIALYDPNGFIFYLNDRDQAGANTTGTMIITIEEVE